LFGAAGADLVSAVARLSEAGLGRWAVIGGVAVTARLGRAHRATTDVDTVVDESVPPDAVAAILDLEGTEPGDKAHRVIVDGTKVEFVGVDTLDVEHDDLDGLTERQQLFVVSHRWALDTAEELTVEGWPDEIRATVSATAPFATPQALMAMKLHAIADRSASSDQRRKRGGDAWDMHQILTHLDGTGAVRTALSTAPTRVRDLVGHALEQRFVIEARLTVTWLRELDQAADVTVEELEDLARPVLDAIM
jgi:hypothetical protein